MSSSLILSYLILSQVEDDIPAPPQVKNDSATVKQEYDAENLLNDSDVYVKAIYQDDQGAEMMDGDVVTLKYRRNNGSTKSTKSNHRRRQDSGCKSDDELNIRLRKMKADNTSWPNTPKTRKHKTGVENKRKLSTNATSAQERQRKISASALEKKRKLSATALEVCNSISEKE